MAAELPERATSPGPRAPDDLIDGHTAGHLAIRFPDDRVLVAADALASHDGNAMLGAFNVDPAQAMETYAALASLDPEIACFGHGEPLLGDAGASLLRAQP